MAYFASSTGTNWNLICADGSPFNGNGSHTIEVNTWYHFAFTREGNVWRGFIDGELDFNLTLAGSIVNRSGENKSIGRWGGGDFAYFRGNIDEFRVSKGMARYTVNFTPQTSPFGYDEHYTKLSFLSHFDGVDGSTTFTDETGKSIVPYGDTKISSTQSKFGGSSAYFDGSGDYLAIAASNDFEFGAGDFTVECWFRVPNITGNKALFSSQTPYWLGAFVWGNRIGYFASSTRRLLESHLWRLLSKQWRWIAHSNPRYLVSLRLLSFG